MKKSETIKNIAGALNSLHAEMGKVRKDAENPFFNSKYSTLEAVSDVSREPLINNKLVITQTVSVDVGNTTVVETTLIHAETGEYISSSIPVINKKGDMQGMGSAITYARRYGLAAILGIVQEDDDGNTTSMSPKKHVEQPKKQTDAEKMIEKATMIDTLEKLTASEQWLEKNANKFDDNLVEQLIKIFADKRFQFENPEVTG